MNYFLFSSFNLQYSIRQIQLAISVIFLLISAPQIFAQADTFVARAGNNYISIEEFRNRFELSPHIFPEDETDIDSMKLDFLYSIIAEKLWADEAEKYGYDNDQRFLFLFSPLEDMYVRDAVFKKEVSSKVSIEPEDISKGMKNILLTLDISIITSNDKNVVDSVYKLLSSGTVPDSLKLQTNNIKLSRQKLNFGDLKDEEIENKLYSLLPGMITASLQLGKSYAIFYLNGREKNDKINAIQDLRKEVKKIITNRRTERQYNTYLSDLLTGINIKPDDELFYKMADAVLTALTAQKLKIESEGGTAEKFYLDETAIYKVKEILGNEMLHEPLFEIGKKSFTLWNFLGYFTLNDFTIDNLDIKKVYSNLSAALKNFIQLSVITMEGYRQNLQNSKDVKNQLSMWKSSYLAQLYKNQFLDSVKIDDEDIYAYYLKSLKDSSGIKQVKVIEFRTDSLAQLEKIFDEMETGKSFKKIIEQLTGESNDTEIKESVFFPITANEIGRIADKMKIGEVYGPIKRFNKYEIFQLLDIKESVDSLLKKFDSVKEGIREELTFKRMAAMLTGNLKELVTKYHIEIDREMLHNIKTGSLNMFVHRYMGFGGRIAAVPYTAPVIQYKEIREIIQQYLP